MHIDTLNEDIELKMNNGLDHFKKVLDGLRTGKASPTLVQDIMVDAYGSKMRLRDIANINTPDPRTITFSLMIKLSLRKSREPLLLPILVLLRWVTARLSVCLCLN